MADLDYLLYYCGEFIEATYFDNSVHFMFRKRGLEITLYFDEEGMVHVFIDIDIDGVKYSVKVEGRYADRILDMIQEIINDSALLHEEYIEV